jgi:hypothetical protein
MKRTCLTLITVVALLCAACGGSGSSAGTPASSKSARPSSTRPAEPTIVGEWQRTITCDERVKALQDLGLGRYAAEDVADDGFIVGVTKASQLKDPSRPCLDAVTLKHSHFFTMTGLFGSRDEGGNQVDDGTWRQTGVDTIAIGPSPGDTRSSTTFHFKITNNQTLQLYPVLPACKNKGCFPALWATNVSYNGLPWQRIS